MPNARDAIHGTRLDPAATTFPTVVYRRYTRGWEKPLRLAYEAGAGAGRFNGPLIRARVGDKLRIHFKNLDTLNRRAHPMHFHGVEYEPSSDGIWLPLFSNRGGRVQPGESFTYRLTAGPGSAGFWPYHDHSTAMEESIAGGLYGGLSIARRGERRTDREFVVTFAAWHGLQTVNGRAFVGNTPVFRSRAGGNRSDRRRAVRRGRRLDRGRRGCNARAGRQLRDDRTRGRRCELSRDDAGGSEPPVAPHVQAAVDVHVTVEHKRRHISVRVHTVPAAKGVVARLELYSRWRYRWRSQRHSRLTADGPRRLPPAGLAPDVRTGGAARWTPWSRASAQRRHLASDRARGCRPGQ